MPIFYQPPPGPYHGQAGGAQPNAPRELPPAALDNPPPAWIAHPAVRFYAQFGTVQGAWAPPAVLPQLGVKAIPSTPVVTSNPPGRPNPALAAQIANAWAVTWGAQSEPAYAHLYVADRPLPSSTAGLLGNIVGQWTTTWGAQRAARSALLPKSDTPPTFSIAPVTAIIQQWQPGPWAAQSGPKFTQGTAAIVNPPPINGAPVPLPVLIWTSYQVTWGAQSAAPAASTYVPDRPTPNTRPDRAAQLAAAWAVTWGAQSAAPLVQPFIVVPDNPPIKTSPDRQAQFVTSWLVDWRAQSAPNLVQPTIVAPDAPPVSSIAAQMARVASAWQPGPWDAQHAAPVAALLPAAAVPYVNTAALLAQMVQAWQPAPYAVGRRTTYIAPPDNPPPFSIAALSARLAFAWQQVTPFRDPPRFFPGSGPFTPPSFIFRGTVTLVQRHSATVTIVQRQSGSVTLTGAP